MNKEDSDTFMTDQDKPTRLTNVLEIKTAIERLSPAFADLTNRIPDSIVETTYLFAGHPVRIRIAGRDLAAEVDKALHYVRATEEVPPALTIEVWDDEEVGPLGLLPWSEDVEYHGVVSVSDDSRYVLNQRPSSAILLDRKESRIFGAVRSRTTLYQDQRARPFLLPVSIWLTDRDIPFIHAALVGQGDRGLLFAGKSGSGKTTASIACYVGGLTYLSDDSVALEKAADGKFVGHSIYATFMHDDMGRFPSLARLAHNANHRFEKKRVVFLEDDENAHFASSANVAGIVIPNKSAKEETTFRPAKPMEALLALAPSSLWMLPNAANNSLDKFAGLLTTTPAFWLDLGRDVDQVAPAIERLFAQLSSQ